MSEIDILFQNKLNEECGVFAVFNHPNAAELTYYGLHSLQHRGQEACGIVTSDSSKLMGHREEGLVSKIFTEEILTDLKGCHAIGHVRYSTAGGSGIQNVQPFLFRSHRGDFGLAHNGNIVNSQAIRNSLEDNGSIFQSTSDTEVLAHLLKKNSHSTDLETLANALRQIEGAFAFVLLTEDCLYVMRDKNGLRPLSIGTVGDGYVVTSETCAFEVIGADFLRSVEPGEIVMFTKDEVRSHIYSEETTRKMCAMEYIYFSRPDSDIEGMNVHKARKRSGKILAIESPIEADMVIGVPDSSISSAIGFAEESKIPYEMGLIKSKYIARTFIQPTQEMRENGVKLKLSSVKSLVNGKRVVMIDDSIVRGTTCKRIVKILKDAGATEVHVRIAAPAITHPCFYGVDTSTKSELISARLDVNQLRDELGCDTLSFLSVNGLYKCTKRSELCTACFDGKYPTNLYENEEEANKIIKC